MEKRQIAFKNESLKNRKFQRKIAYLAVIQLLQPNKRFFVVKYKRFLVAYLAAIQLLLSKFDFEILRQNLTFVSLFSLYVVMAAPRGIVGGNLFWKVVTLIGLHID